MTHTQAHKLMEIFKDIAGYEGRYMVSNMGRIKSMQRTIAVPGHGIRMACERLLNPSVGNDGRLRVNLCINGNRRTYQVHRLVAAAFIGPCPDGMECCHNNGDPINNAVSNLRYDTRAGNHADKILHGTHGRGERNSSNKLTEAQVLAIRADTRIQRICAAEHGIGRTCVSDIRLRKTWGWL